MGEPAKRILVVDDEEDVQILVCRILKDAGYEVDSAADGGEAIQKVRGRRPDLVILDLMMPGVDGWGFFEHLHGDTAWIREAAAGDGAHPSAQGYRDLADVVQGAWITWIRSAAAVGGAR